MYKDEKKFLIAISLMFFFLGIAYEGVYSYLHKNHIVNISLPQKTAIIGIVDSPVEVRRYSKKKTLTTFVVEVKKVRSVGANPCIRPNEKGKKKISRKGEKNFSRKGENVVSPVQHGKKSKWIRCRGKIKVNAYNIVGAIPCNRPNEKGEKKFLQKGENEISQKGENVVSPVQYGDEIRLWGEVKIPPRATNPGQFDYRDYLAKYGIHVLMNVYGERSVRVYANVGAIPRNRPYGRTRPIAGENVVSPLRFILRTIFTLRTAIKQKIDNHIKYPYNTILSALLIGYRSEIPQNIRDDFVKTGTVHVLAISGLHISIVTAFIYYFFILLGINRFVRAGASIFFMLIYTILTGFRFLVQRAALMGSIIIIGMLLDRKKNIINAFFLAFLFLILIVPESLFLAGFQLSFITVFSIIILTPHIMSFFTRKTEGDEHYKFNWADRIRKYVLTGYAVSIAVILGSSVFIIYLFNIFSPVSSFANVIVVPFSAASIISGIIFTLLSFANETIAQIFSFIPLIFLKVMIGIINVISRIPFGFAYMQTPHPLILLLYYVLLALFLILRKKYFTRFLIPWIGGLWLIFMIGLCWYGSLANLKLFILDAGCSDIIFIKTSKENILINTGRGKNSFESRWILKPFLMSQGINKIDNIIISSFYKIHIGGLDMISNNFKINRLFKPNWHGYNGRVIDGDENRMKIIRLEEDEEIAISPQLKIQVLYGPRNATDTRLINSALVLRIVYKRVSFLICPLIYTDMISKLINDKINVLKSDVIIVSSRWSCFNSLEKSFLRAVSPRYVIITGKMKKGIKDIRYFLKQIRCVPYYTNKSGCITIFHIPGQDCNLKIQGFLSM